MDLPKRIRVRKERYEIFPAWFWECGYTKSPQCYVGKLFPTWHKAMSDADKHARMHRHEDARFQLYPCYDYGR